MAANKTIGGINVTITASVEKFQKNIAAARQTISRFAKSTAILKSSMATVRGTMSSFSKSISGAVFNLKTLGAALATGAFAKLVADQFEAVNALKDLSDKTGVSTDKLAGLQLAAEEAGISNAVLEKGLVKLSNVMGMAGDQALRAWIDKTSKLSTQQEKLAAATEMFGSRGADMVRFLNGGTGALDEAQKAAESMGLAVSQDVAIGIDRASEAFARFKMSVTGIFRSLAGEIAPFIELLSIKATEFVASNGGGKGMGTFIADVIIEMAKNVADLMQKMVAGVLRMAAMVIDVVNQVRGGRLAGALGLTAPTEDDFSMSGNLKNKAAWLEHKKNLPSTVIQGFLDSFRKQSEDAAAKWKSEQGTTGLLDGIIGDAKRFGMGSLESWKGAGMGLWGAASGGFSKMAMAAGAMSPAAAAAAVPGRTPALSFAESGSVESYRQQAAIRKQGDDIAKKQLGVQQQIRDGIKDLAGAINLPAANLKG